MSRSITSNARRAVAGSTCASLGSLVTSSRVGAHRRLLGGLLRRAALDEEPPPHAGRDRARLHAVPALQLDLGTIPPIGKACWRCPASCATVLGRHDGDAIRKTRRPTVAHPTFISSSVFSTQARVMIGHGTKAESQSTGQRAGQLDQKGRWAPAHTLRKAPRIAWRSSDA